MIKEYLYKRRKFKLINYIIEHCIKNNLEFEYSSFSPNFIIKLKSDRYTLATPLYYHKYFSKYIESNVYHFNRQVWEITFKNNLKNNLNGTI